MIDWWWWWTIDRYADDGDEWVVDNTVVDDTVDVFDWWCSLMMIVMNESIDDIR